MSNLSVLEHYPSFAAITDPYADRKCIFRLKGSESYRQCRLYANKDDFASAQTLIPKIRKAIESSNLGVLLRDFAIRRCCRRHHQQKLEDNQALLNGLCFRWKQELENGNEAGCSALPQPSGSLTAATTWTTRAMTRSQTKAQLIDNSSAGSDSEISNVSISKNTNTICNFSDGHRKPRETVEQVLKKPLGTLGQKKGTLYIFTRPTDPKMVKIGHTTNLKSRVSSIQSKRHFKPEVRFQIENLDHVWRTEKLIHAQLRQTWRKELVCNNGRGCETQHEEWFEVNINVAKSVMEQWAKWMSTADPYNMDGSLKENWIDKCDCLIQRGCAVDAMALLGALPGACGSVLSLKSLPSTTKSTPLDKPRAIVRPPSVHVEGFAKPPLSEAFTANTTLTSLIESLKHELVLHLQSEGLQSNTKNSLNSLYTSVCSAVQDLNVGSQVSLAY